MPRTPPSGAPASVSADGTPLVSSALESASDAEIARLCAEGNEKAWAVLVRRYRRLVFTVPYRAGLDTDTAEEIFQSTFAKLATKIRSLKDPGRVRAWVVTTARRLTIDAIRARQASRTDGDAEDALLNVADPQALTSEVLEQIETQHLVRQALARLGGPCRRLLTALFYRTEGPLSYETIAAELQIPVGSIGPTRSRCLQKLMKEYQALDLEG